MTDWVLAVERAYVAAATGGGSVPVLVNDSRQPDEVRALAALGAVASRYLAVGTPRTFGLVADATTIDHAVASLAAHRTWFQPRELRCAGPSELVATIGRGGISVTLAEALASDIVCVHTIIELRATQLRRGTHVNVLGAGASERKTIDAELRRIATIVEEHLGLGALAAGLVDGRQLDELTIFIAGDAAVALGALAALPA